MWNKCKWICCSRGSETISRPNDVKTVNISLLGYKGFLLGVPDFGACRAPKTLQGPPNWSTMENPYISSWLDHQMFNLVLGNVLRTLETNEQSPRSMSATFPSTSSWFLEQGEEVIWIGSRTVLAAHWSCTGTLSSIPVLTAQIYPLHLRGS